MQKKRSLVYLVGGMLLIFFTVTTSAVEAAKYVEVNVRVEAPQATIFSGQVYASGDGCEVIDSAGVTHQIIGAKALCALSSALAQNSIAYELVNSSFGLFLNGVGTYGSTTTDYWLYFVNDRSASVGLTDYELTSGDELLLTYGAWPNTPLRLTLNKSQVKVGKKVVAKVAYFDEVSGTYQLVEGAVVLYGDEQKVSNKNGRVNFVFSEEGEVTMRASMPNFTSSNSVVIRVFKNYATRTALGAKDVQKMIKFGRAYLKQQIDKQGLIGGSQPLTEWGVMALAATSKEGVVPAKVKKAVRQYKPVAQDGATEIARHILALKTLGENSPINFVRRLKNTRSHGQFGMTEYVNDDIFAGLALWTADASDKRALRQAVQASLAGVNADGGVSYAVESEVSDIDTTAAFIQLLSQVKNNKFMHVKGAAVAWRSAIKFLKQHQNLDGGWGYTDANGSNAASTAWVLQAWPAAGEDGTHITSNYRNGFDFLFALQKANGAFSYDQAGSYSSEVLNTIYALLALQQNALSVR